MPASNTARRRAIPTVKFSDSVGAAAAGQFWLPAAAPSSADALSRLSVPLIPFRYADVYLIGSRRRFVIFYLRTPRV
jgi:hypothetical protein